MKINFKLNLKVSAFYLEKQKSFILKKNFKPMSISKQKSFVYCLNFPEGFANSDQINELACWLLQALPLIPLPLQLP